MSDKITTKGQVIEALLREAVELLENIRGDINPERGYVDELEADIEVFLHKAGELT